jgi:hypothetical protein
MTRKVFVAAMVAMSFAFAAMAEELTANGRAKLAEMIAFARDGPTLCGGIAPAQASAVVAFYAAAGNSAPSEEEIAAKQGELAALKFKIGDSDWCRRYYFEMKDAETILNQVGSTKDCSHIEPKDRTLDCPP